MAEQLKSRVERAVLKKWMNWRAVLMAAVIAIGAIAVMPGSRVSEIRDAFQPFNFALVDPKPGVDDWPCSRGIDGRNIAASGLFPKDWNSTDHKGWQTTIPGYGKSTPIVWGQQLFVPSYENQSQRISLYCLNRNTGRFHWQTVIHQGGVPQSREKSALASSTPACDGQNVFTVTSAQDRLWVTAVDLKGRISWQQEAGPSRSKVISDSSPVFYKSLVIVSADQEKDSFLAALHRQTGRLIWRIRRPRGESSGSPVVTIVAGRPQLVLAGTGAVKSYDPATGDELWSCRTSAERVANSVTFDDERVFVTKGHPNREVICINANGSGDVTKTHIEWRLPLVGAESTSPIHHQGLLYVLSDDGRLSCIHATSGKLEWNKQLKGTFAASPVIVQDSLFCANEAGGTFFVPLGASYPQVVENSFGNGIFTSPVFVGDSIFIRTADRVHRIASATVEPVVEKPAGSKRRL